MKNPQMLKLFLTAFLAMMGSAGATTALIDFGRADSAAPSPYNSVVMLNSLTGEVALLDTDSVATGWLVSVVEDGNGNGGSAGAGADVTDFPPDLVGFDAAALGDSIFANQGTPQVASMTLLFTGLSTTGSYDLLLYGSRGNGQPLDQRWSLTEGIGGGDVDHVSGLNSTVYVDWPGVIPNESGEIEITINCPGPDTAGALALNFASITEASDVVLISSFSSNPDTASPGNPAILSWEVNEPLDSLDLDDGSGNITDLLPLTTAGVGSISVEPTETTTYTLTGVRDGSTNIRSLTVVSGAAPEISSFTPSDRIIEIGSSVDLSWSVNGATSLVLDPGGTDVFGTSTINLTPAETTIYTLTATNAFGSTTADVLVELLSGPLPTNRNVASSPGNLDSLWLDLIGDRNWGMTGALLESPLTTPSANTNITAAYTTTGEISGGATPSFQYPEFTAEIWFRPGALTADHQVVFETGGGQNGLSALITETEIRLLGSELDVRNLDVTIPTAGLNLADFVQLVITNNAETNEYTASVRDTFGNVRTVSETAEITIGVNGGGIFYWASGGLGVSDANLGGRTDAGDASPAGMTGFGGEIGIVNIYDRVLDSAEIQAAFSRVATTAGASGLLITEVSFDDLNDELTITWNSINGQSYLAEFSTSLETDQWFELAGPFTADGEETTEVLNVPPNRARFFVRVVVATP